MKNSFKLLSILLLASCVVFTSCKKEEVKVTGVSLSKTSLDMEVGDNEVLIPTITPDDAANKAVTWRSNNETVATVDVDGKVTAVGEGEATITVRTDDGGYEKTCHVRAVFKMEDNFEITAVASLSSGTTIFDLSKIPVEGGGNAVEIFDIVGRFLTITNTTLTLAVKNTSGKVIPAGTSWEFRFKRNGIVLTHVLVEQEGSLTLVPLKTDGVLATNLGINETFVLYEEPMRLNCIMDNWGANSFCVEVLKFGKSPYPESSVKSNCYNYQVIGKN